MMEFTYDGIVRAGFGFYNPNHAAALICALLPFCWNGFLRWKPKTTRTGFALAAILLTTGLAMTFSRTGILIFFFELFLFALLQKERHWCVTLVFILAGIVLFATAGALARFTLDRAFLNRFDIWRAGVSLIAANPLNGVGFGNSGRLATAFLLRDGINCRTLLNSHLTLLTEFGMGIGLLWNLPILYALFSGRRITSVYISFAGLVLSACSASIFDWGILFDFRNQGGLSTINFVLSWLLFLLFLGETIWLCCRKFCLSAFGGAAMTVLILYGIIFLFAENAPKIRNNMIIQSTPEIAIVLYENEISLKTIVTFLQKSGISGYRLPLYGNSAIPANDEETVILFGQAAEYATYYAGHPLYLVNPPVLLPLPKTVRRVYLKRFPKQYRLIEQAEAAGIPVIFD